MNKCTQCEKPAIQKYGDNYLCLDCLERLSLIQNREHEQRHREIMYQMQMANSAEQQFNDIIGGHRQPSFDLKAFHPSRNIKHNTVNVNNSVVGNISTEEVGNIQVSLEKINQGGDAESALALKELTETVLQTSELDVSVKNELLEQLSLLTEQAALPAKNRKPGLIKAASSAIKSVAGAVGAVATAWQKVEAIIEKLLSNT